MAEYKNQHFVQQTYLNGFSAKNLPDNWKNSKAIWVLSKKDCTIKLKSIKKTASRSHYYSFLDKNGKMNPLIEKWFQPVENEFLNLRKQIKRSISDVNLTGKTLNLPKKYHSIMAEYLYIHLIRVPKVFDYLKTESIKFYENSSNLPKSENDINAAQILALRSLIRIGVQEPDTNIKKALLKRNLSIIFFPRSRVNLVTSDNPVILYDRNRDAGLAHKTTDVYFPLNSSCILKLWGEGDIIILEKNRDLSQANDYNKLIALNANEEIYSADKEVLKFVADKLKIEIVCKEDDRICIQNPSFLENGSEY